MRTPRARRGAPPPAPFSRSLLRVPGAQARFWRAPLRSSEDTGGGEGTGTARRRPSGPGQGQAPHRPRVRRRVFLSRVNKPGAGARPGPPRGHFGGASGGSLRPPPHPRRPGPGSGWGSREAGSGRWGARRRGRKNKREPRPLPRPARGGQSARPPLKVTSDWPDGDQSGVGAPGPCGPTWGDARGGSRAAAGGRGVGIGAAPWGPDGDRGRASPRGPPPQGSPRRPSRRRDPERRVRSKRCAAFRPVCGAGPGGGCPRRARGAAVTASRPPACSGQAAAAPRASLPRGRAPGFGPPGPPAAPQATALRGRERRRGSRGWVARTGGDVARCGRRGGRGGRFTDGVSSRCGPRQRPSGREGWPPRGFH